MKILVINGPSINFIGIREKNIYGTETYEKLIKMIEKRAGELNIELETFQSNHEGAIVDKIQEAYGVFDGIVINPAAYTHTSVAILDVVKAVEIPTVEVHISDVNNREDFRKISYIRVACVKSISNRGFNGYIEAMEYLNDNYNK
ncbi:3-dehydroquinate dehydratase [Anaerosphaera aminiphila DSM 21120]|uniref:3-dehydroquinate dehydratase n=1 Tax=Anaerosphaera aminiphila DSM 21120 TaxID=1120995 RepID=A0A1M5PTN0_9FIRM|nr:type II 3-dehydroquinate dehydratase [Anaerosphaera aminiphila]SHH04633.1 3-dehydroquinate dehydratase [Anaerosphaera aminiphila DSM 21120]